MATISLRGNEYVLATDKNGHPMIKHGYAPRVSDPIRTTGVTTRADDPSIGHYFVKQFSDGVGWGRLDRLTGQGVKGLRDSTCDTRYWPTTIGRLNESQSHAAPADHPKAYANFASDFWAAFEQDFAGGTTNPATCRKFGGTSDNWTGGGTIDTPSSGFGCRVFDMVVHKAKLYVAKSSNGGSDERVYTVFSSSDGVTWTALSNHPAGTGNQFNTTITQRNNFDDDEAKLLDFGNLLISAHYDTATDSRIEVYSTSDAGATAWTAQGTTRDRRVQGLVVWRDPTAATTVIPVLVTERNVYKINTTTNTLDRLLPDGVLTGDDNDGRGAVVGTDGNLYVSLGSGKLIMLRLRGDNQLDIIDIGPPGDGFVTAKLGHVNKLLTVPGPWLIAAYGGHAASRNATIWAIDYTPRVDPATGKEYRAWHCVFQYGTANVDMYLLGYSTEDDNTGRLHFALEDATSAVMNHIEEFLVHPNASTTIKYQTSGLLNLPVEDFGNPQVTSTIIQARVNANSLTAGSGGSGGASDEFITLKYGLNGASDTTTTLGDFLSGQLTLTFGASNIGVAATTIGTQLTLTRSTTNTNTPKLLEFEYLAEQRLLGPRWWDFTIDIGLTAKEAAPTRQANTQIEETIIANLETAVEDTVLWSFTAGGMSAANVRVPNGSPPVFDLWVVGSVGRERGYRTGYVTMRVQEML